MYSGFHETVFFFSVDSLKKCMVIEIKYVLIREIIIYIRYLVPQMLFDEMYQVLLG